MPKQPFKFPNLIFAFSRRDCGNMSLVYGDTKDALKNRRDFLGGLGIDYRNLVCAQQVHGSRAAYTQEIDKGRGALSNDTAAADTDAFITDKKNVPLAIFTAYCLSIFLYDPKSPAIGLVHAGWRSIKENIAVKTIKLMQEKFNTDTDGLYASFGPGIRSCCYEVGREFSGIFTDATIEKNNRYYLDLAAVNKKQLSSLGVREKNIFDTEICTFCRNQDFFSYRKEKDDCGRMISVMMLK